MELQMESKNLVVEFRREYQIPPFHEDAYLESLIEKSIYYFQSLVDEFDIEKDLTGKELVLIRSFYAYHKKLDEFGERYQKDIFEWEMSYANTNTDTGIS